MKRLDATQREAAAAEGPLRVVAGAGTGKTAVIAERVRRLVGGGADPDSILVLTFTDRAAGEMRQRIEELIGREAPAVGTVHSLAFGWLRADGRRVGVPQGFRIVAGAERWILARELMWKLGDPVLTGDERPDDLVAPLLAMLERLKQELVPLQRLDEWARAAEDRERGELMGACVRLFKAYERECRRLGLLDFDDLLARSVEMLTRHPELLAEYRRRYPHVLVDEYQDLNLAQERLVELVAQGGRPFVVGDDDQSIYRFRGASRASLERFGSRFPGAASVALGRNHRSSRRIVAAAAAVVRNNGERLTKDLVSSRPGPKVELWSCGDAAAEAQVIAAEASRLIVGGLSPAAIAVLCRTNAIARPIAEALAGSGLPHVVTGAQGLLDRPEIRDAIALLRSIRDAGDEIADYRVNSRTPATPEQVDGLRLLANTADVRDLFFELMNWTRYLDGATQQVSANISRFAEMIAEFCDTRPGHSLGAFMDHLELVLLSGEDESRAEVEVPGEAIAVMTIHQAKGLEFEAVFVPSLVEGRLPQSGRPQRFELPAAVLEPLVRGREDVIAEERRLLYVAMTRARSRLYLTRAERYEGGRRWRPSRFLDEVRAAGSGVFIEREIPAGQAKAPAPTLPHAATEGTRDLVLSYSSIQAYLDCPRQYWFRYERHLPAAQSAEAVQGVILHEVLRRAGEDRRDGGTVTAERLRELHDEVWSDTRFPDERRASTFRRNGLAQLEAFRIAGGFEAAPALLEREFSAAVDGFTLHGVIDRVDHADSGWSIIDYKTGRPIARRRRDLQVALYALGAETALDLKDPQLEIVYLASGSRVRVDGTTALLAETRRVSTQTAEAIRGGHFEPQPERRKCRLCPYRLACTEAL
jgi:DNA helicase-2/ATP-dependent DNA helicase PcrA